MLKRLSSLAAVAQAETALKVLLWKRGQPLQDARVIWSASQSDAVVLLGSVGSGSARRGIIRDVLDYERRVSLLPMGPNWGNNPPSRAKFPFAGQHIASESPQRHDGATTVEPKCLRRDYICAEEYASRDATRFSALPCQHKPWCSQGRSQ
jgi:hypothetical protein